MLRVAGDLKRAYRTHANYSIARRTLTHRPTPTRA
jgi:hypothetical protein